LGVQGHENGRVFHGAGPKPEALYMAIRWIRDKYTVSGQIKELERPSVLTIRYAIAPWKLENNVDYQWGKHESG